MLATPLIDTQGDAWRGRCVVLGQKVEHEVVETREPSQGRTARQLGPQSVLPDTPQPCQCVERMRNLVESKAGMSRNLSSGKYYWTWQWGWTRLDFSHRCSLILGEAPQSFKSLWEQQALRGPSSRQL